MRRYRLLPYLDTLFWESSNTGMPVMIPHFFNDPKAPNLRKEQGNFLIGSDLLVVPKWNKEGAIPSGNWRNISINGENSINHKYHPDLKIRPGAILPICRPIYSTSEFSLDTITLLISLDANSKAKGRLYTDSGEGYAYENGQFSLVEFTAEKSSEFINISTSNIEGNPLPENTIFNIQIINDNDIVNSFFQIKDNIVLPN